MTWQVNTAATSMSGEVTETLEHPTRKAVANVTTLSDGTHVVSASFVLEPAANPRRVAERLLLGHLPGLLEDAGPDWSHGPAPVTVGPSGSVYAAPRSEDAAPNVSPEHVHDRGCASRNVDDLFRGDCDCGADDPCGDGDCDQCYPEMDEDAAPDAAPTYGNPEAFDHAEDCPIWGNRGSCNCKPVAAPRSEDAGLREAAKSLFDPMTHGSQSHPNDGHEVETLCPECVRVRASRYLAIRRALRAEGAMPTVALRSTDMMHAAGMALAAPLSDDEEADLRRDVAASDAGTFRWVVPNDIRRLLATIDALRAAPRSEDAARREAISDDRAWQSGYAAGRAAAMRSEDAGLREAAWAVITAWDEATDPRINNRLTVKDYDAIHDEAVADLRAALSGDTEAER